MVLEIKNKKGLGVNAMLEGGICLGVQKNEVPARLQEEYDRIVEDLKKLVLKIK